MKKIALISTFCDTEEKKSVLIENSRILKSIGVDVMVNSPLHLDSEMIQEFDFYFRNRENPILSWPEKVHILWSIETNSQGQRIKITRGTKDYGWAALYQIKKLSEISLTYDYDVFYHMNYDILLDENLIEEISAGNNNKIYPVETDKFPGKTWLGSPLFSSFTRETLQRILDDIQKEKYLQNYAIAEDMVYSWVKKFDLMESDFCVRDRISLGRESDIFSSLKENTLDYSKNPQYKLFWSKIEGENFKFLIWGYPDSKKISVIINGISFSDIKEMSPIVTEVPCTHVNEILVIFDDSVEDYLKEYQETIINWIDLES